MTAAVGWWGGPGQAARAPRSLRRARNALVRAGLIGCAGLIAVLGLAAALVPSPTPAPPAIREPAPAPAWIAINRPLQLFNLAGSTFARLPLDYEARRRPDGSARQDTLTFGAFAGPTPFFRVSLGRFRGAGDTSADFVVTTARIAGAAGIAVLQAGQPEALQSRFGLFAVAPVMLKAGPVARACVGFRLEGRPAVAIGGVACGPDGRAPDQNTLACAIDRLDLASAGEDGALRSFFVEAERRRGQGCGVVARA